MERFEETSIENTSEVGGTTAVDTQAEVDSLCGGVGFDDSPSGDDKWLEEARKVQNNTVKNKGE